MNTQWLRRFSASALAVVCFALLSAHALAIPATLPQPNSISMSAAMPQRWHERGPSAPAMSPALALPPATPFPVPTAKPPVDPPEPDPPDRPPGEPPAGPPAPRPIVVPKPQPPVDLPALSPPAVDGTQPALPEEPSTGSKDAGDHSSMELIVKFSGEASAETLAQAGIGLLKAQVVDRIPQLGVEVVRVTSDSPELSLDQLRRLPGIAYVEPNYPIHILDGLDDPDVPMQWHLDAIEALAAWDLATGSGVTIAVIDTGADPAERDLKDRLVPGYDFVNGDTAPWDDQGHGTRVALIAAATANNGYGGAGVAYDAQVMPVKALNDTGSGTHAWIAKAIVWAADNGADVINLSVGGPYSSQTLGNAVDYAWRRGVVLVAAAGNGDSNAPVYPAAYGPVLAVAGTTRSQQRASFSNWGEHVSVAAPGADIVTQHGDRHSRNGTSLASPQVAGVAALVLSRNQRLGNEQVRDLIQVTATDLGDSGWDPFFGFGQVNAYQAVLQAREGATRPNPTAALIEAVNQARKRRDLPPLLPGSELMASAQARAEGLTSRCTPARQISPASCQTLGVGESAEQEVAVTGVSSPQAVVELLASSPAGEELLFGPSLQIGVGFTEAGRGGLNAIWVLRFEQAAPIIETGPPRPIPGTGHVVNPPRPIPGPDFRATPWSVSLGHSDQNGSTSESRAWSWELRLMIPEKLSRVR